MEYINLCLGSTCYVVGGVLTLKISKKKNENVTGSILIWATIILEWNQMELYGVLTLYF